MPDLNEIKPVRKRTLPQYLQFLIQFLPIGTLWNYLNSFFTDFLESFAVEYYRNDGRNIDLQCEAIPGLSTELLSQWEADVLLPEELPELGTTIEERRIRVQSKLTNTPNNPTAQFFENLALARGVVITITQGTGAFRVGVQRVGERLQGTANNFTWIVNYVSGSKTEYNALEPTFRLLAPAWELLIFNVEII